MTNDHLQILMGVCVVVLVGVVGVLVGVAVDMWQQRILARDAEAIARAKDSYYGRE